MENNNSHILRIPYYDALRVFAAFLVVTLHVAAQNWSSSGVTSLAWNCFNVYDSISRCGVPIFVMISGALFLSRDISLKKLFTQNVLRMLLVFCIWSVIYAVALPLVGFLFHPGSLSVKEVIANCISGHYHMWFIPLIIGLYICVPILKKITEDKKTALYFIVLSFVFSFLIPEIVNLVSDFLGGPFETAVSMFNGFIQSMRLDLITGYTFYFIVGFVISEFDFSRIQRRILYLLGIMGVIFTIIVTFIVSFKTGNACKTYYNNISANVALYSIAIFVWFRYNVHKVGPVINEISKRTLGIYLIHIFVLEVLNMFGLNSLSFMPVLSVPALAAMIFLISFFIAFCIGKIPFAKKMKIV